MKERDPKKLYKFLVGKLPPSTAHRWAYQRIPRLVGDQSIGEGDPSAQVRNKSLIDDE
jgi:hypothetical protein